MEYAEDWSTGRPYISRDRIEEHQKNLLEAA